MNSPVTDDSIIREKDRRDSGHTNILTRCVCAFIQGDITRGGNRFKNIVILRGLYGTKDPFQLSRGHWRVSGRKLSTGMKGGERRGEK